MVRIAVETRRPTRVRTSLLVLPVAGKADAHVGGASVTRELKHRGVQGKFGERAELGRLDRVAAEHVLAVGVGAPGELESGEVVRRLAGTAVSEAKRLGLTDSVVALPAGAADEPHGRAAAEGVHLANYQFTVYSDERARRERRRPVRLITFVLASGRDSGPFQQGVTRGTIAARATILARDLVNTPSAHMTPRTLAATARDLARGVRAITVRVFGPADIEKLSLGAYAAVARGSDEPPQFIHLTYKPETRPQGIGKGRRVRGGECPRIVLVGKGITFDSGGYSLKTAEGMETMKTDMAGGAAVLGVFSALRQWRPAVEVHGIIAACENLVSGRAMKPGDIVRAKNGKTIVVENTDAEGRLTLADALSYAVDLKPDAMVDLATLTGACVVALGEEVAGLFSNHEGLAARVQAAAAASGEPVWRLPLPLYYRQHIKSEIADFSNIGKEGRAGGAITAALFLREFVGKIPWAHLDIAGPSYAEKQTNPTLPAGGTGFGVRTVIRYLESLSRQ